MDIDRNFWLEFHKKNQFLYPDTVDQLSFSQFCLTADQISNVYTHLLKTTKQEKDDQDEKEETKQIGFLIDNVDDEGLIVLFQFSWAISNLFYIFILLDYYSHLLGEIGGIGLRPELNIAPKIEFWSMLLEPTDSDIHIYSHLARDLSELGVSLCEQVNCGRETAYSQYQKKKDHVVKLQQQRIYPDAVQPPTPPPPSKFYFVFLILKQLLDQFHQSSPSFCEYGWNIPKFHPQDNPPQVSELLLYLVSCVRQLKKDLKTKLTDFSSDVYYYMMMYQSSGLSHKFAFFYEKRDRLVISLASAFTFFREHSKRLDPRIAQSLKIFFDELELKDLAEDEYRT